MVPPLEVIPDLSDHDIMYVELQIVPTQAPWRERQVSCYRKVDWDGLRTSTAEPTASILPSHAQLLDAEAVWTALREGLMERVQQCIPHRHLGPSLTSLGLTMTHKADREEK